MSEILYGAQKYFPRKCIECPFLIGLIEDGEISPSDDVSREEVFAVIRPEASIHNFEACPGPTISETADGDSTSCNSFPEN